MEANEAREMMVSACCRCGTAYDLRFIFNREAVDEFRAELQAAGTRSMQVGTLHCHACDGKTYDGSREDYPVYVCLVELDGETVRLLAKWPKMNLIGFVEINA